MFIFRRVPSKITRQVLLNPAVIAVHFLKCNFLITSPTLFSTEFFSETKNLFDLK